MFGKFATAVQFLLIGLTIGLLTAPRSGRESRRILADEVSTLGKRGALHRGEEFAQ